MKTFGIPFIIVLIFFGQAVSLAGSPDPNDLQKLKLLTFSPPDKAPAFTLKNLEDEEISLSMFHGKPLMLYFWATW